jgi:hypothetical protein
MANDYQGEVRDFALVVPVPVVLRENQVEVANPQIMERLDAFSAPRLVEYFDPDPCAPVYDDELAVPSARGHGNSQGSGSRRRDAALGVTVEAQFAVGEYDILILSARESGGLETWLIENGYQIPRGARQLLRPYIRQGMKFFVAKVNLEAFESSGYQSLRPLKISYDSPRFMLPIRLGMVNAQSEQDLIVYLLSPEGQVEVSNYRTVKVPSNAEIPVFVKDEFSDFYKSMFETAYTREGKNIAFMEYAWDMGGCDPCSAQPLNPDELRQAGVFWLRSSAPTRVFLTRLHVRYTRNKFPEDLMFQQTRNQEFFQGRYILRHPFTGNLNCSAGWEYRRSLRQRQEQEAQTLARLTRWNIQDIRQQLPQLPQLRSQLIPWWQGIWSSLTGIS